METTRHSPSLSAPTAALVLGGRATPFEGSETANEPGEEDDPRLLSTEGADRD